VATVGFTQGAAMIRNENAQLVGYVYLDFDTSKTDVGTFVNEAKKLVESSVVIPSGFHISWSGQFENMERVKENLKLVLPITFLLIIFLMYLNTKSWIKTAIVFFCHPFFSDRRILVYGGA
jgi:Cu(I)/Ag(I) efflux system membrane protein CusA/SilA